MTQHPQWSAPAPRPDPYLSEEFDEDEEYGVLPLLGGPHGDAMTVGASREAANVLVSLDNGETWTEIDHG